MQLVSTDGQGTWWCNISTIVPLSFRGANAYNFCRSQGISQKFADRFFNHFTTNISSMCGHGQKNQEPGSLFFSTKPIPRIHGAQTYIGSHMVRSQTRSRVRRIDQWLLEWQYKSKMGILKQNKFTCWKKLWTKTLPEFGKVKPAQLNFGFVQCMGAAHGTCKIWAPGTQLIKTSPAQTNSSQSWKKQFRFLGA